MIRVNKKNYFCCYYVVLLSQIFNFNIKKLCFIIIILLYYQVFNFEYIYFIDFLKFLQELRYLDKKTGVSNIKYTIDSKIDIIVVGVFVKIINVVLDCDLKDTFWCLKLEYYIVYKVKGLILQDYFI